MIRRKSQKFLFILIYCVIINISIFSISYDINNNDFVIYSNLISKNLNSKNLIDYSNQSFMDQLGIDKSSIIFSNDVKLARAISNSNYPVSPGDVFNITYKESDKIIDYDIKVTGDYSLHIPGFEIINTYGYTFPELKQYVIDLIKQYYAFSVPQFSLVSVGNFSVTLRGEVESTKEVYAWGLSRLSDVVDGAKNYADYRSIEIKSSSGEVKTYDLFAALKFGDLTQNPLLKSDDLITLKKAKRIVIIDGEVYNPGIYQLLDSDDYDSVIQKYAGGLLQSANKNEISVYNYDENGNYEKVILSNTNSYKLKNNDLINVPSISKVNQSLSVIGAISYSDNENPNLKTNLIGMSSGKIIYYFLPGEKLSSLVERISPRFNSSSDLVHSYVLRNNKRINVDIQSLLNGDLSNDLTLMPSDTIIIPFDQKFVNVQGAVDRSSSYAYAPDKRVDYYIALAGGLNDYATGKIEVVDKDGNILSNDMFIPSEATIKVEKSDFQQNLMTTVAVVGLVSTVVTIIYNISRL